MKIIISTKVFANVISAGITEKCKSFELNSDLQKLIFSSKNETKINIVEKFGAYNETYTFDAIQMFKVLNALSELQEQPIVVEFDQVEDEILSIKLSQFEHWF